jgi:5'-3' exonuclease
MIDPVIVVDSNYLCHLAKHSMGNLSYDEMEVGVIFGFMRQIITLSKAFKSNKFVFIWDSKSSKRKEIFPEYKLNRHYEMSPEDKLINDLAYKQFTVIRKDIIPELGFTNNFCISGYEGDDLMASFVSNNHVPLILVSSDNDLYQCLVPELVKMYFIRTKKFYTSEDFWNEWGISNIYWADVKSISGCKTDGVPGVAGVGEKTAVKYIRGKLKPNSPVYLKIKQSDELIFRNRKLVTLPFSDTPKVVMNDFSELSLDGFLQVSNRFGFQSMLTKEAIKTWKDHLKLQ